MSVHPVGNGVTAPESDQRERLRQSAKDFEGVFLAYVFRAMRQTVPESGNEGEIGQGMFTAMFDDALARMAANQQTRGLAEGLYRQLARHLPDAATSPPGVTDR